MLPCVGGLRHPFSDLEKVAVALANRVVRGVAVEIRAALDVGNHWHGHLQGHRFTIGASITIRSAGNVGGDRSARSRRVRMEVGGDESLTFPCGRRTNCKLAILMGHGSARSREIG